MARFDPVRSPVLDTLLAHRPPLEPVEPRSLPAPASLGWLRIALVGFLSLAVVLVHRFPPWAVLAFPTATLTTLAVRRRRWPFRAACSAVLAGLTAQVVQLAVYTWPFRFAASFALFTAAAFCWGLRMDELD